MQVGESKTRKVRGREYDMAELEEARVPGREVKKQKKKLDLHQALY